MLLPLDAMVARQRYDEMLKESEQIRLAKRVAKASGKVSLLSRMVKLLSRSSNQPETLASGTLNQHTMAEAKVR